MSTVKAPFSPRTAREAAQWLTLTMEGNLSPSQEQALRHWRDAHPDNERAWLHIEAMRRRMAGLEPQAGYRSLSQQQTLHARRRALKALLWLGLVGGAGHLAYRGSRYAPEQIAYSNGAHAPRTISLSDGSQLTLDADSEISVQFDDHQRLVHLRSGRVLLSSGHGPGTAQRPLRVQTPQGSVRALGTRFVVELQPGTTHVALFEGAVELLPLQAGTNPLRLGPGQHARFSSTRIESHGRTAQEPAWSQGVLIADAMRLDAFLAQLSRYRPGLLRCSEEVASLHISGVYPLADSDAVLDALAHSLPVQIRRRSNYWVTVAAR
ncbi:MAG: FecR domain-containing protein [Pseudomonas sp.]